MKALETCWIYWGFLFNKIMAKNRNKIYRKFIYEKYKFTCNFCKTKFEKPKDWDGFKAIHNGIMWLEIDHIIPLSKGGLDKIENKQALCQRCNTKKGDKIINNE